MQDWGLNDSHYLTIDEPPHTAFIFLLPLSIPFRCLTFSGSFRLNVFLAFEASKEINSGCSGSSIMIITGIVEVHYLDDSCSFLDVLAELRFTP